MNISRAITGIVKRVVGHVFRLPILAIYLFSGFTGVASANPEGGQVVGGSASISSSGSTTTINQSTDKAIINWQTFNISAGEKTQFNQPSSSAIILNRVLNNNQASQINGQLTANGRVVIVNRAGIVFGETAKVDVGGLIATTADINNDHFMAGQLQFNQSADSAAVIINKGEITAAEGGLVALVAPAVVNSGVITARLGKIALTSANAYTIDFYGDQLINFTTNAQVTQAAKGEDGQAVKDAVKNSGQLIADGGKVQVSAKVARGIVDNVINMEGVARARSVSVSQTGEITLLGGNAGIVRVAGKVDVSGKAAGQKGGKVKIAGEKVGLMDNALVDASGDAGGGEVLMGGDYQGKNITLSDGTQIANSTMTYVGSDAQIDASAIGLGDGGKIIIWGNEATQVYGQLSARGGALGGKGGFIETSTPTVHLYVTSTPDVSSIDGGGTWLLDPGSIFISSSSSNHVTSSSPFVINDTSTSATLSVNTLLAALTGGVEVIVSTGTADADPTNNSYYIQVNGGGAIDYNGKGTNTLTFKSAGGISLFDDIYDSDPSTPDVLNLNFYADMNNDGIGATSSSQLNGVASLYFHWNTDVNTGGGNLVVSAANLVMDTTGSNTINVGAGSLTLAATGDRPLVYGTTGTASDFVISSTELSRITATGVLNLSGTGITIGSNFSSAGATTFNAGTGTLTVNSGVNVDTNGNTLNIAAGNLVLTGTLNSGASTKPDTIITATGTVGLGGSSGTMGINGTELQNITASNLTIYSGDDSAISVNGVTATHLQNITGMVTLDATAGTTGKVTFVNNTSTFSKLTVNADNGIAFSSSGGVITQGATVYNADADGSGAGTFTIGSNIAVTSSNNALSVTAANLNISSTGASISAGSAALTLTGTASVGVGSGASGTMGISSAELQSMTAGDLTINSASGATFAMAALSENDFANISGNIAFNSGSTFTSSSNASALPNLAITAEGIMNLTSSGSIITTGALSITSNSASENAINLSGNLTSASNIELSTPNSNIAFNNAVTLSAANGITLNNDAVQLSNLKTLTFNADNDGNGSGTLQLAALTMSATQGEFDFTANDIVINGVINSGLSEGSSITITGTGSIGLGNGAGDMSLTGAELQNIATTTLNIYSGTDKTITIDGLSAANTDAITDLNLYANTGVGSIISSGSASTFNNLVATATGAITLNAALTTDVGILTLTGVDITLGADVTAASTTTLDAGNGTLTLNSGATLNTVNNNLFITASDLVIDTSGSPATIDTGFGLITLNATGSLGLGSGAGTMSITSAELQRFTGTLANFYVGSNSAIIVDGVSSNALDNLTNGLMLRATVGTTGEIIFSGSASSFSRNLAALADSNITVSADLTATNGAYVMLDSDLDNNGAGKMLLGANLTASGNVYLSSGSDIIQVTDSTTPVVTGASILLYSPLTVGAGNTLTLTSAGALYIDGGAVLGNSAAGTLNLTAASLNLSGAINTTGVVNLTSTGSVGVGSGSGILKLNNIMLSKIVADTFTVKSASGSNIVVDNVTSTDTDSIEHFVLDATTGSGGSVTFQNNAATFQALTVNADGAILVDAGITTAVENLGLTSTGSNITINSALTSAGDLILQSDTSTVTVSAALQAAGELTVQAGSSAADAISLSNNLTSTGAGIVLTGKTTLSGNPILSAADGITLNDNVVLGNGNTLVLNANSDDNSSGTLVVANNAAVGVTSGSGTLTITARDIILNSTGTLSSGNGNTSITTNGSLSLGDTAAQTMTISGSELQNITAATLTLTAGSGSVITVDNITAANSNNIGTVALSGTGALNFSNTASTFNALTANTSGTITVGTHLNTDTGALSLTSTGSSVTINSAVSATGALSIDTGSSAVDAIILAADLASTGSTVSLADNVTLGAASSISAASAVTFSGMVNGSYNLTVDADGTTTFAGAVGNTSVLGDGTGAALTLSGSGATNFNSTLTTVSGISAVGAVTFADDVTLGDGDTGTTLNGNVTFNKSGSTLNFSGYDGLTFGNGSSNQVTLSSAATINSNNSALIFNAKVDGTQNLTLNSDASGNITFNADVGSANALAALTITNANNVTNNGTISAYSFTQTAGSGTTALGSSSLHTSDATSITTANVTGAVQVASLSLGTNTANLTGTVNGLSGQAGADAIILLNTISSGTHFFDGIDLNGSSPTPPAPNGGSTSNLTATSTSMTVNPNYVFLPQLNEEHTSNGVDMVLPVYNNGTYSDESVGETIVIGKKLLGCAGFSFNPACATNIEIHIDKQKETA